MERGRFPDTTLDVLRARGHAIRVSEQTTSGLRH
jgi:hypothetical protein